MWPPAQPASTRVLIDPLSPSTPPVPWLSSFYTSASLSSPLSSYWVRHGRWRWHHSLLASRPRTSLCLHHRRPPALCERGRRRQEWRVQVRPSRPQWLCNSFLTCISQGLRVTSMDDLICTTATSTTASGDRPEACPCCAVACPAPWPAQCQHSSQTEQ
jgi:hypothetical protein